MASVAAAGVTELTVWKVKLRRVSGCFHNVVINHQYLKQKMFGFRSSFSVSHHLLLPLSVKRKHGYCATIYIYYCLRYCTFVSIHHFYLFKVESGTGIQTTNECPHVGRCKALWAFICIALHGNRPIPYSHYPGEIQLGLEQGKSALAFETSTLLKHILPQSLIRIRRYK